MSSRKFCSENLDAGDVNRNQNNSQHEHAQSECYRDEAAKIDIHAGRGVDEATGEFGAENREDAEQRETKELEETAKINPKGFDQNVPAWRLAGRLLIFDFSPSRGLFRAGG